MSEVFMVLNNLIYKCDKNNLYPKFWNYYEYACYSLIREIKIDFNNVHKNILLKELNQDLEFF